MENSTFWSITGEVAGMGPALSFDGAEMPNKIEVRLKAGGKFFLRTVNLPSAVPVVMGKKLTLSGIIEIFRSKKTNKDYERMTTLGVADAEAPPVASAATAVSPARK
jgi:hypothetical protein